MNTHKTTQQPENPRVILEYGMFQDLGSSHDFKVLKVLGDAECTQSLYYTSKKRNSLDIEQ